MIDRDPRIDPQALDSVSVNGVGTYTVVDRTFGNGVILVTNFRRASWRYRDERVEWKLEYWQMLTRGAKIVRINGEKPQAKGGKP